MLLRVELTQYILLHTDKTYSQKGNAKGKYKRGLIMNNRNTAFVTIHIVLDMCSAHTDRN